MKIPRMPWQVPDKITPDEKTEKKRRKLGLPKRRAVWMIVIILIITVTTLACSLYYANKSSYMEVQVYKVWLDIEAAYNYLVPYLRALGAFFLGWVLILNRIVLMFPDGYPEAHWRRKYWMADQDHQRSEFANGQVVETRKSKIIKKWWLPHIFLGTKIFRDEEGVIHLDDDQWTDYGETVLVKQMEYLKKINAANERYQALAFSAEPSRVVVASEEQKQKEAPGA